MFSYGEEFTYTIDGNLEYFTCIGDIKIKDNEYVIGENEDGIKKAFYVDEDEEELYLVSEDDEENILEVFDRISLEENEGNSEYANLDDEYEYESRFLDNNNDDDDDEELDGFIDADEMEQLDDEDFDEEDLDSDLDIDGLIDELFEEDEEDDEPKPKKSTKKGKK